MMRLITALFFLFLSGSGASSAAVSASVKYVGRSACAQCHMEQEVRWRGSHHDLAMQEAADSTVLGDFDDAKFEQFGVVSQFFREDGRFMVRTDGPDGQLSDYPIKYTFGVYPLQQYLIEFPGGRLQALDIAWDSRPKEQGGQRWFHIHPKNPIRHNDALHWTGPNLNWNYMCADCHSTNLKKNYDAKSNSYHTTWSELDVSCEACHGPGSAHLSWAEAHAKGETRDQPDLGLTIRFNERVGVTWRLDEKSGKLKRSAPKRTEIEIQVCARCHSRRSQLTDEAAPGQPFMDNFRPSLLDEGLYHPDGQVEDEVYVWGSFLQSRMYQAGVTCSDCHDPHAATLRQPDDQVCYQCHQADRYAKKAHHFHPTQSSGAGCVACHMPPTNYMVVDARHDHSFRVPRPDLSVAIGVPNACNKCHSDKTPQWAARRVKVWYGRQPEVSQNYAPALHASRRRLPGARQLLQALAADLAQPTIARATALSSLGAYPDRRSLLLLKQGLKATDPLERMGALNALKSMGLRQRSLAFPLLWDEVRAVRIEAARLLALFPSGQLPEAQKEKLDQVIQEYMLVQEFNAERPESQLNLGSIFADLGRYKEAELAYRRALQLQPRFIPAFVNMAQMLSDEKREQEAANWLKRGLDVNPQSAILLHALGLSLIRQKKYTEALEFLARAAELAPDISRYSYVYAVALKSGGKINLALKVLRPAHRRYPGDSDILYALAILSRDAGYRDEARSYAIKLRDLLPEHPAVDQLLRELNSRR